MVEAVSGTFRRLLSAALLLIPTTGFAHRLDENLQATLVEIEPTGIRLDINLTPGESVAKLVVALIDRNRDGVISPQESTAYAGSLLRDLTVRLDQREMPLKLTASEFPTPEELRSGDGIIHLIFSATSSAPTAGTHELTLENRHLPAVSVYLINAAQPEAGTVQILRQSRNEDQSTGKIEFSYHPPVTGSTSSHPAAWVAALLIALIAGVTIWKWKSPAVRRRRNG